MKLYLKNDALPDVQAINALQTQINQLIGDFKELTVELSVDERRGTRKLGARRLAYAETASRRGTQYLDVMPRNFEATHFEQRLAIFKSVQQLLDRTNQLHEMLEDTRIAAGIDAMTYTKLVHDSLRSANMINPSYDDALSELDEFNKRATQEEETEEEQATEDNAEG